MKPRILEQKLALGKDAYGRHVIAVRQESYEGKTVWAIESHPVDMRGESLKVYGLTDDNLLLLAQAIQG